MTMIEKNLNDAEKYFNNLPENTQEQIKEYIRVKNRTKRHGQNILLKRGRPRVTESHKKRRRVAYLEKQRQKKKDQGTYIPRGRPRKKVE
jgi:hypothetical protein